MARSLLLVAVALLALQGTSAATLVDSLFDALKNQTNDIITEAEDYINDLEDKVNTKAEELWDGFKEKVEAAVSSFETEVEDLVAKADATGEAVAECARTAAVGSEELAQNLTNAALACITDPINEAKLIEEDLYQQILTINSTFFSAQSDLADCATKLLTSLSCSLKVLSTAVATAADVTSSVTTDITNANTLITTFQSTLEACEASVIASIPTEGAALISDISDCFETAVE